MLVELSRISTADGIQLDGSLQRPSSGAESWALDGVVMVHGTGGNFYSSSLFDFFSERLLERGCAVLRVNTRGHDGISNAVSARGGLRLGAAYECVDDCRHDLKGWVDWLREQVGPRVLLAGHSMGALKSLYTAAHDPDLAVAGVLAISPPRLSYAWFCQSGRREEFLGLISQAQQLCVSGKPNALMEATLPLPMVIAAGSYLEKYGPDERYHFPDFLRSVKAATLFLFGSIEVDKNIAFQSSPELVAEMRGKRPNLEVATIPGADHFYSGVRAEAWAAAEDWLTRRFAG